MKTSALEAMRYYYNIQDGEKFNRNAKICFVIGNYPNAALDTVICYHWWDNKEKRDGTSSCPLPYLLLDSEFNDSL